MVLLYVALLWVQESSLLQNVFKKYAVSVSVSAEVLNYWYGYVLTTEANI